MSNRMVDTLKMIEENAVKIRSNSARISRVQAELKRLRDGGEMEEPEEEEGTLYRMQPDIDLHGMDFKELEEALNRITRMS